MAYSELIKNFEKIRTYMREFYVYGFKSRSEYNSKSARSYDDERRRLESWLGEYMHFAQTPEGKNQGLIDINTADEALLCTLPGIGTTKAQDIIAYRTANGRFETIEDIMKVPGIKEHVYRKLQNNITVR